MNKVCRKYSLLVFAFIFLSTIVFGQNLFFHLLGNSEEAFTWTGSSGDSLWSTPSNWSTSVVPGATDIAKFKGGACVGANCNVSINSAVSVAGLSMSANFTGVITQGSGLSLTVGTSGYTQAGGTFTGSNSNITINNILNLSGGIFTSTSAQLLITSGFNFTGGTFNHNNGLLRFDNGTILTPDSTINVSLPGVVSLYNLQYSGGWNASSGYYIVNITSGSFDVQNQFQIGRTTAGATGAVLASGGTINLRGNLTVDPSYPSVNATPTNLIMNGSSIQGINVTGGRLPQLTIDNASGIVPTMGSADLIVDGLTLTNGSFTAPQGVLKILGNFSKSAGTTYIHNGASLYFDNFNNVASATRTISLDTAITTNHLTFDGGVNSSAASSTWVLAGVDPTINVSGNLTIGNTKTSGTGSIINNGGSINLTGNYNANLYAGGGTTNLNVVGTGTQNYTKTGAGSALGGLITVNKASGGFALATAASFNSSGQDLTITTGTMNLLGFNLTVNDVLTVGVNGTLLCNGGSVTAGSYVINGFASCGPSAGITWTGLAGDNLWSTAGNWTNNTIPGASDIAIFNSKCAGANCNVTIASNLSVKGVKMQSDYVGVITQNAGVTLTVGTSGWMQIAGSFVGGNSAITMNGAFSLSGGSYTASSGVMTLNTHYTLSGSPTFTHNSGTLLYYNNYATTTITPGVAVYNNVTFAGNGSIFTHVGTFTINGTLTLADTALASGFINGGVLQALGNVVLNNSGYDGTATLKIAGNGNQSVTSSSVNARLMNVEIASTGGVVSYAGTINFNKNFLHTSGSINAGTSTFVFNNSNTTTTITPGSGSYNNVSFSGWASTFNLIGTFNVDGNLLLNDSYDNGLNSHGNINTGTILVKGNVTSTNYGNRGTGLIRLVGSSNQTITGTTNGRILNLEIASTGGVVTLSGTVFLVGNYIYTSGTIDSGSSTLQFYNNWGTSTITPGPAAYNNVNFQGNNSQFTLNSSMTVNGTLSLADTNAARTNNFINTGTILASGNVVTSGYGYQGSGLIRIVGSTNQTITGSSTADILNFELASTGGVVTIAGSLKFSRNYTYTSGTVDAGTSLLTFYNYFTSTTLSVGNVNYNNVSFAGASAAYNLLDTLYVNGDLILADSNFNIAANRINTGTIYARGHVTYSNYGYAGTVSLIFDGAISKTLNSFVTAMTIPLTTINKSGGASITMVSDVNMSRTAGQDLIITGGVLNLGGFDLTVQDVVNVGVGTTITCSGGDLVRTTLINNGTVNCPGDGTYGFNWTGSAADGNWNNSANWSGGVVPGVNDTASFSDTYCGSNCSLTIASDPNVRGISLESNYTGTMTQASVITMGSVGWRQKSGQFVGNGQDININGYLKVFGGTFSPLNSLIKVKNSIQFNGTGVITLTGTTLDISPFSNIYYVLNSGSTVLNNVTLNAATSQDNFSFNLDNSPTINGNLVINNSTGNGFSLNSNQINVRGNFTLNSNTVNITGASRIRFTGSSNQNIAINQTTSLFYPSIEFASTGGLMDVSGHARVAGNFIYTSGSFTTTKPDLTFQSTFPRVNAFSTGALEFNNFTLNQIAGFDNYTINVSSDIIVNGILTLINSGGNPTIVNGSNKIYARGNVSANFSNTLSNSNSALFRTSIPVVIAGSTNQTVNLTGGVNPVSFPIEIASTGGLITPTGTWAIGRGLSYTSGTFSSRPNVRIWTHYESPGPISNFNTNAMELGNVEFFSTNNFDNSIFNLISPLKVSGTLRFEHQGGTPAYVNGAAIEASDNLTITGGNTGFWGTSPVELVGTKATHNISMSLTNSTFQQPMRINKTGGIAYLTTNFTQTNAGLSAFNILSGTLNQQGFGLTINGRLNLSPTTILNRGGGAISYGSLVNNGTINP